MLATVFGQLLKTIRIVVNLERISAQRDHPPRHQLQHTISINSKASSTSHQRDLLVTHNRLITKLRAVVGSLTEVFTKPECTVTVELESCCDNVYQVTQF